MTGMDRTTGMGSVPSACSLRTCILRLASISLTGASTADDPRYEMPGNRMVWMAGSSDSGIERGEEGGEMVGKLSWPLWVDWSSTSVGGSVRVGKGWSFESTCLSLLVKCFLVC